MKRLNLEFLPGLVVVYKRVRKAKMGLRSAKREIIQADCRLMYYISTGY
ncbi:MAG: hypothetical protein ACOC2F_04045 [Bacteroidota bacterium]